MCFKSYLFLIIDSMRACIKVCFSGSGRDETNIVHLFGGSDTGEVEIFVVDGFGGLFSGRVDD